MHEKPPSLAARSRSSAELRYAIQGGILRHIEFWFSPMSAFFARYKVATWRNTSTMANKFMEYMIKPSASSALAAKSTEFVLDALDHIAFPVNYLFEVPELIDIGRFNAALSTTLSHFPLFAGRLQPTSLYDSPWVIRLSGEGVPVAFVTSTADGPSHGDSVSQRPVPHMDTIDVPSLMARAPDVPLARFTITHFPSVKSSCIGLSRWHALGNAFVAMRLLRMLSQLYQGLPAPDVALVYEYDPQASSPTIASRHFELDTVPISRFNPLVPAPAPAAASAPPAPPTPAARIEFRLSAAQLKQLQQWTIAQLPVAEGHAPLRLSRQDCLVALVAACINRADKTSPPVERVTTILDYRGVGAVPTNLAGNALTFATTARISTDDAAGNAAVPAFATGVRAALQRFRDPEYLAAFLAVQGRRFVRAARDGTILDLAPQDGYMTVNSTLRSSRNTVHFGHPTEIRFFSSAVPLARYVRLLRPNPRPLADGTWLERPDDAEVSLFLPAPAKDAFRAAVDEMVQTATAGAEEKVEWVV